MNDLIISVSKWLTEDHVISLPGWIWIGTVVLTIASGIAIMIYAVVKTGQKFMLPW